MNKILNRIKQLLIIIKYYICLIIVKIFFIKNDDMWLISERGDEARDNGYTFYKYLKDNHQEVNVKYVITKKSQDIDKIVKEDVVVYRSFLHHIYYITAGYLISTHTQGTAPEFHSFTKLSRKKMLFNKGKEVFLQHGITKDYIPIMNKKNNPTLKLFICGAYDEFEFLKNTLGYSKNEIKYTGFSRFDYLKNSPSSQILLMPTWRNYLYNCSQEEFLKSEYYKTYQSFITNKNLENWLKKENSVLIFYPHYEVQKFLNLFKTNCENIKIASINEYDVQQLLVNSKILITDYSSVFFDFAYMKKNTIYYQFDYEKYRKTQYAEGYFNYKNNGFGPVVKKEEELLDTLKLLYKNKIDNIYLDRINNFFRFNDCKNSERIYEEIKKIK